MNSYAIGRALLAGGQGLGQMAQDQFKDQIDAADNAQRTALMQLQQEAENERAQAGLTQKAQFHQDQQAMDQAKLDETTARDQETAGYHQGQLGIGQQNADTAAGNEGLHARDVGIHAADVNSAIAARQDRIDHPEKYHGSSSNGAAQADRFDAEQAAQDLRTAKSAMAKIDANSIDGQPMDADAAQTAKANLAAAQKRYDAAVAKFKGDVAPIKPVNAEPTIKKAAPDTSGIPDQALSYLRAHPETKAIFDKHYNRPGLAEQILGQDDGGVAPPTQPMADDSDDDDNEE